MVQKGYGWMLKEASKPYQEEVFDFVMKNKTVMPRTALRYAIEKDAAGAQGKGNGKVNLFDIACSRFPEIIETVHRLLAQVDCCPVLTCIGIGDFSNEPDVGKQLLATSSPRLWLM